MADTSSNYPQLSQLLFIITNIQNNMAVGVFLIWTACCNQGTLPSPINRQAELVNQKQN